MYRIIINFFLVFFIIQSSIANDENQQRVKKKFEELSNFEKAEYYKNKYSREGKKQSDLDNAILHYNEFSKDAPNDYGAFYNLAELYEEKGSLNNSKKNFERAIELNPSDYGLYYNFGNMLKKAKDYKYAKDMYQKAVTYNERDYGLLYHFGDLYEKMNDKSNAIKYYERAYTFQPPKLETFPDYGLKERLERLYSEKRMSKKDIENRLKEVGPFRAKFKSIVEAVKCINDLDKITSPKKQCPNKTSESKNSSPKMADIVKLQRAIGTIISSDRLKEITKDGKTTYEILDNNNSSTPNDQRQENCSATLVHNSLIMTSGQCVPSVGLFTDRGKLASNLKFILDYKGPGTEVTKDQIVDLNRVLTASKYKGSIVNNYNSDYALISLSRPIKDRDPIKLRDFSKNPKIKNGDKVSIIGLNTESGDQVTLAPNLIAGNTIMQKYPMLGMAVRYLMPSSNFKIYDNVDDITGNVSKSSKQFTSGAAVILNDTKELVGILHSGATNMKYDREKEEYVIDKSKSTPHVTRLETIPFYDDYRKTIENEGKLTNIEQTSKKAKSTP